MFQLASMLFAVIGTTLAGVSVLVVLLMGLDTLTPILIAAAIGAVVGMPASWLIARKICAS